MFELLDKIKSTIIDNIDYGSRYNFEKSIYDNLLKFDNENVPEELKFLFSLKRSDGIKFMKMILQYFGRLHIPGCPCCNLELDNAKYFELKKEFLAKINHEEYIRNEEIFRTHYIPMSVFISKEAQDIAYSAITKDQEEKIDTGYNPNKYIRKRYRH